MPGGALHGHGQPQESAGVGDGAIEFLEADVERRALRAARLLVETDAVYVEAFENRFVEKLLSVDDVGDAHFQFDPANKIGDEPIQANQIFIGEKTFDARRFETSLGQQGFGEVAKLADGNQFADLQSFFLWASVIGGLQMAAIHFIFERVPGEIGEGVGVACQAVQLAIGHASVGGGEALTFPLVVEEGFVEGRHWARIIRRARIGNWLGFPVVGSGKIFDHEGLEVTRRKVERA
jgi:hypothetical protein